jgi:nucleotide-binding universal stress UspA family protein
MHKFLVPIDDSDNAGRAFQYALELAKERAIKLYIVTVLLRQTDDQAFCPGREGRCTRMAGDWQIAPMICASRTA